MVSHIFVFSPVLEDDSHFDEYFSTGLKPPTRTCRGLICIFKSRSSFAMTMIPFIMMIPKTKKKTTIHRRSLGFFSFQRFKGGCHLAPIPFIQLYSCGPLKNHVDMNDLFKMIGKATSLLGDPDDPCWF